jgi:hypothetical protein
MHVVEAKEDAILPILQYACGSTLVCDTKQDAIDIGIRTRTKCVSLDGTQVRKEESPRAAQQQTNRLQSGLPTGHFSLTAPHPPLSLPRLSLPRPRALGE